MYNMSCHVETKCIEKEELTFSLTHKRQVHNIKQMYHFKSTDHEKKKKQNQNYDCYNIIMLDI